MKSNITLQIWLKDGSIFKDWTLTQADIKVGGLAFDINTFRELDSAFLYVSDGTKIYRDRVTGTIAVHGSGITGSLTLSIEQIEDMLLRIAGAGSTIPAAPGVGIAPGKAAAG
jgi:hypothetical protein